MCPLCIKTSPVFTSSAHISSLAQLSEILKFGIDKLLSSDESSIQDVKLEKILGLSRNGHWVDDEDYSQLEENEEDEEGKGSEADGQSMFHYSVQISNHYGLFLVCEFQKLLI